MSPTPYIIMAAVWGLIGAFVTRWPETLAGYNTMPPERRAAGFFTDNYDRPIVVEGVTLRDMILLRKRLRS